jgi:GTPase SAR1 family protein
MAGEADELLVDSGKISTPLIQLQSKDHEEILNVIDQLRLEGISKYISLPQLIVCGDQSSGKSSVLEAISGLEFPAKDNVCTRFATELILRRAPESGVTASIHSDDDRPTIEAERIRNFRSSTVELAQFATIVKEAENHIGVGREGHMFSKDVLRVEVSGPNQPHLTLVDLPGLYHAPDESQSAEGVEFVESLVLSYIRNKRSVILAVISAKSDIALQKVTAFTRKVDPEGKRTMGIITKPDTLPKNSDMERSFLNLALNKRVLFRLGWHVLKNREYHERHFSLDQRRESEIKFVTSRIWATLPRSQVGIESLRPRLSTVLRDHILSQLPSLIAEASQSFKETEASLQRLGEARDTVSDQRRYLLHSSEHFSTLMGNSIDGVYFNPFFSDAMEDEGYEKRLRAVVQNRLSDFSDILEEKGMQRRIIDDAESIDSEHSQVHHSEFVGEVQQRMRRSRGRELPGTFNPLIIGDLFYLQSKPWETIVTECIDTLLEDVHKAILPIVRTVLDEKSSTGLLEHIINPSLDKIEVSLRMKTDELLHPQQSGHPITYNHYFTEIVQKAREEHLQKSITEKLKKFFGNKYPSRESMEYSLTFRMDSLIDALGTETEASMERFACSEAINCMQAYYKVLEYCSSFHGSSMRKLMSHRSQERSSWMISAL